MYSNCCFGTGSCATGRSRKWIFLTVTKLSPVCAVQTKPLYFTANPPSWENSTLFQRNDCNMFSNGICVNQIFWGNICVFFMPRGRKQHTYEHGSRQQKVDVFLGRSQSVSHLLIPPSSSSTSIQSILNWSTASPLLTEAKLLKTPLLKWSTHFTFPLRTWKCGAQILCRNI